MIKQIYIQCIYIQYIIYIYESIVGMACDVLFLTILVCGEIAGQWTQYIFVVICFSPFQPSSSNNVYCHRRNPGTRHEHFIGRGRVPGLFQSKNTHPRNLEFHLIQEIASTTYPLVNVYITMDKSPCFMGKLTINGHFQQLC